MSIVKKIILVIIILLFTIILYRLFEQRRIIQKNMENHQIALKSLIHILNPKMTVVECTQLNLTIVNTIQHMRLTKGVFSYQLNTME